MPKFTIQYELTERTIQRIEVEADTVEGAIELVEEYEFDNGDAWEFESIEWTLDNVRSVADAPQ